MKKLICVLFIIISLPSHSQESKYDNVLKSIKEIDYSLKLGSIEFMQIVFKSGSASKEAKDFWVLNSKKDTISVNKAKLILDTYGFLGEAEIGKEPCQTLYKRILRSEATVMEKYLPILKDGFKSNKLSAVDYAIFEDTYLVKKGLKQKYGTQQGQLANHDVFLFLPIQDPENIDVIRLQELGLKPLKEQHFNWDLEKYFKNLKKSQEFLESLLR